MTLREIIKNVQRELPGVEVDGVAGSQTMLAVLNCIRSHQGGVHTEIPEKQLVIGQGALTALHDRTVQTIATLDAKARENFLRFAMLAEATAATFGCDYIAISGTRTMDEQAELKLKSNAGGPHAAAPGFSWHNFGIAVDFGVFQAGGKTYCDDTQPALAQRVHAACAGHAKECGIEWGGTWVGKSCDPPHYQIYMGHSSPTAADRTAYRTEGSVL